MTLPQFYLLSEDKRLRNLLLNGVCIGDRKTDGKSALLFQLQNNYTEVFFSESGDEVLCTRNFDNTEDLLPYLEDVNVKNLLP